MFMLGGSAITHHINNKMYGKTKTSRTNTRVPKRDAYNGQQQSGGGNNTSGGGGGGGPGIFGMLGNVMNMFGGMFGGGGGGGGRGSSNPSPPPPPPPQRKSYGPTIWEEENNSPSNLEENGSGGQMRGPNVDELLRELQQNALREQHTTSNDDLDRIEIVSADDESHGGGDGGIPDIAGEEVRETLGGLFGMDSNAQQKDMVERAQQQQDDHHVMEASEKRSGGSGGRGGGGRGRGSRGGGRGSKKNVLTV
jgi:hypothetical protein